MQLQQLTTFISTVEQALQVAPDEVRRLFHGRGRSWEGLEQITCDWLQGQLVVSLFKEVDEDFLTALRETLITFTQSAIWSERQGRCILLQHRYESGAPAEVIFGELESRPVVVENGLKYQLHLGSNQNAGLFFDMRLGREWVQNNAKHANLLNLFAYTCGFSVAAIAGGADQVVNLDMAAHL
ncbi:methyltransferase [Vibrio astriarenae]|nr:methyltransferase [Vibrio sp. C7]